jgi:hypothetical protein
LTCDLVGAMVARAYITRTPGKETLARRLSRAIEHNCVEEDGTDEAHLSPRNTMRALLSLDPTLGSEIMEDPLITFKLVEPSNTPPKSTQTPTRRPRRVMPRTRTRT